MFDQYSDEIIVNWKAYPIAAFGSDMVIGGHRIGETIDTECLIASHVVDLMLALVEGLFLRLARGVFDCRFVAC